MIPFTILLGLFDFGGYMVQSRDTTDWRFTTWVIEKSHVDKILIFMGIIIAIFWLLGYYDTEYPIGYYDTEYPPTNSDIITKLGVVMTAIVTLVMCEQYLPKLTSNNRFEESNFFSKETKYWFKMFVIILWLFFMFLILMI
ncbi:MAG: hypothetical protein P8K67_02605 [Candidatus Marinimicrobia bacterium]|nr:hypothetical protein [Candidatus Neomarinimicrobiota bacterium]